MGTMGQAISLSVQNLRAQTRKVVKQIETPRPPDPIMRRLSADHEEKRVTHGATRAGQAKTGDQNELLDLNDPNEGRTLRSKEYPRQWSHRRPQHRFGRPYRLIQQSFQRG